MLNCHGFFLAWAVCFLVSSFLYNICVSLENSTKSRQASYQSLVLYVTKIAHPLDRFSRVDCSTTPKVPTLERTAIEISRGDVPTAGRTAIEISRGNVSGEEGIFH